MSWNIPLMKHDKDGVPSLIQEVNKYYDISEEYDFDREKLVVKLFNGYCLNVKKIWIDTMKPYNLPKELDDEFFMQRLESFIMKHYKDFYSLGWKDGKEVKIFGV